MANSIIIVLGKGVYENGTLPAAAMANVEKAVEVHKETRDKILMSGRWSYTYSYKPLKTEAQAMKEYAVKLGVDKNAILIEDKSKDTLGNAFFSKKAIKELGNIDSILVVVSDNHANRSRYVFEKVFGDGLRMSFVEVKSKLSFEDAVKRKIFEEEALLFLQRILGGVTPGNDLELQKVFDEIHPLYAKDPATVPEWVWLVFESRGVSKRSLIERRSI